MSSNETPPNTGSASAPEQIPHSGRSGHEFPVREFDKTSLEDAPLDFDPRKPGDLTTEHLPKDLLANAPERNRFTLRQKVGATVALVALGAGVTFGVIKARSSDNGGSAEDPAPNPDKTVSAPATPGETNAAPVTSPENETLYVHDRTKTILSAEEKQTFETFGPNYSELTIPVLDNMQSIILELYKKGGDPSDVDFSSVTDDPKVKQQLRLIAEEYLEKSPDLTNIKMCLPTGDYAATDYTEDCGTFGSELVIPGMKSVVTIRGYTESDPNAELTKNTNEFYTGFTTKVNPEDNSLKLVDIAE